ncbi:hypothetical protein [Lacrimispora brassicae]
MKNGIPNPAYSESIYALQCDKSSDFRCHFWKCLFRRTGTHRIITGFPCLGERFLLSAGFVVRPWVSIAKNHSSSSPKGFVLFNEMFKVFSFLCVNDASLGESVVMDIHKGLEIPLMIIKFPLESGEIEMLVTNIFDSKLKISDYKELYFRR